MIAVLAVVHPCILCCLLFFFFGKQSQTAFGQPQTQSAFGGGGGGAFGTPAGGGLFGQSQPAFGGAAPSSNISPFGQSQSAFGASKPFGTPSSGFGGGQLTTGAFGGFGGASPSPSRGTRATSYRKTQEVDTSSAGTKSTIFFNSISCMPEYSSKSAEELRWEDYQDGVRGGQGTSSTSGMPLFGQPSTAQTGASPFGAVPSTTSFGQQPASSPWGAPAQSQPLFGAASSSPSPFGGASASSTPAFGGAFGAPSSPSPFGVSSSSSFGFGAASSAAPATSLFGASAPSAFGQQSSSPFGAPAGSTTPGFGGFKGSSPAFGMTASQPFGGSTFQPAFGATPGSQPAFGSTGGGFSFGGASSSTSLFGASSTPASGASLFGAKPSSGGFSFGGAQSTPSFGAPAASGGGLFGQSTAAPTPSFGGSTGGGFSFGAAQSTPTFGAPQSTGGGLFGASTPASAPGMGGGFGFGGAASTPSFGGTTPSSGGLFGGVGSAPAFGGFGATTPSTGGLFGAAPQSTPSFNFTSQLSPTPGGFAVGQPSTAAPGAAGPVAGTSPYGSLPAPPQVTPLPEYRIGLTQRMIGPPSGGPPRPIAFITPRSLTPQGGKLRPRRGSSTASAARLSRSPAEFFAAAARGGLTPGIGATPSPSDGSAVGTPNGNIFVPRDDPRKLFIRDSLPSTESAMGMSPSPADGKQRLNGSKASPLGSDGAQKGRTPLEMGGFTPPTGDRWTPTTDGSAKKGAAVTPDNYGNGTKFRAIPGSISDSEVSKLLPKLTQPDYYIEPSLTQLAAMARDDPSSLSEVANFVVGRRGVGSIRWIDPVDVRGIDLDSIVALSRGSVEVYLDDRNKPDIGSGLNRAAEITMLKVFKIEKSTGKPTKDPEMVERYARKLKKVSAEQGARFVSYDGETGTWKFEVEHFSKYGLLDLSDDDDREDERGEGVGGEHRGGGGKTVVDKETAKSSSLDSSQDFHRGSGREQTASHDDYQRDDYNASAAGLDEEEDEEELLHLGVRRRGVPKVPREDGNVVAATAGKDIKENELGSTEDVTNIEKTPTEERVLTRKVTDGHAQGAGGQLLIQTDETTARMEFHESLAKRAGLSPEDLLHLREGLYSDSRAAEFQQKRAQVFQDRKVALTAGPGIDTGSPQQIHMEDVPMEKTKAVPMNCWARRGKTSLEPPAWLKERSSEKLHVADLSSRSPTLPSLPMRPMRVAPSMVEVASPCPLQSSAFQAGFERCIPDAGAFLGLSFRVGWAPGGVTCGKYVGQKEHGAFQNRTRLGDGASRVTVRRIVGSDSKIFVHQTRQMEWKRPSSSAISTDIEKLEDGILPSLRQRFQELLRLQYENSLPDPESESDDVAPLWTLCCSRYDGHLHSLMKKYIEVCAKQARNIIDSNEGGGHTRTAFQDTIAVLRHQQGTWELIDALFSAVSAEMETKDANKEEDRQHSIMVNRTGDTKHGVQGTSEMEATGLMTGSEDLMLDEDEVVPPSVHRLVEMQRRAKFSSWLKKRIAADMRLNGDEASPSASSRVSIYTKILRLLMSHKIPQAVGLAVSEGNVRLAGLLATAGMTSAVRERIGAQLAVWKDAAFDSYMDNELLRLYSLMAGHVGDVISDCMVADQKLGWKRAVGMYLWYGYPSSVALTHVLQDFAVAVEKHRVPFPIPYHVDEGESIDSDDDRYTVDAMKILEDFGKGGNGTRRIPFDVQYELIQLYCRSILATVGEDADDLGWRKALDGAGDPSAPSAVRGDSKADTFRKQHTKDEEASKERIDFAFSLRRSFGLSTEELDILLAKVLHPIANSYDILDYSFSWQLLCVLRSIGALRLSACENAASPMGDGKAEERRFLEESRTVAQVTMGFVSQLENLGGMVHWAIYVALHLADRPRRSGVVRYLLSRYCPEWAGDEEIEEFLSSNLRIPANWLAEAKAMWATVHGNDVTVAAERADAGDWAGAHAVFCEHTAPSWLLEEGASRLNDIDDALDELEPHADEIDAVAGAGAWFLGGGLYRMYLDLKDAYDATHRSAVAHPAAIDASNEGPQFNFFTEERESLQDSNGDQSQQSPSEERMQMCAVFAERLNRASRALKLSNNTARDTLIDQFHVSNSSFCSQARRNAVQQAALARMAEDLSMWMLLDAQGELEVPNITHSLTVSGLEGAKVGRVAAAVQVGAVALAATLG